ncbi:hypothetical protein BDN70DRAFT_879320 [Pholiota conissans]|uniref:FAD-binding FR-type domain-containing protein n=1 Tax=Pholiota conissans TaxID=109636 RepID=A0A9P5Z163_9AGAR|nr:hypothetical protein BDN70DRAFT_879320 [Pholiota conissans]
MPLNFLFQRAAKATSPTAIDKALRVARSWAYPKQILYLLASFTALLTIIHFASLTHRYLTRRRIYPSRKASDAEHAPVQLQRLPLALADSLRALAFRWTVPIGFGYTLNVAEVFLAAAYMAIMFTWTFVNTKNQLGQATDPKYYANRAGNIACSQIPVMVALGMRNNIISWLTGISFDRVNYLHRLSARVILILSWIHAGGRLTLGLSKDEAASTARWMQCGILAVSSLTLLCILSVRPARKRAYEFFLAVHLVFAMIFIFGTFFHLAGRNLTYYGVWPAMIIWGLDRLLRVLQVIFYNRGYFLPSKTSSSPSPTNETLDAQVTLLTPHFVRISMRRPSMHWHPGQSAFLSFPEISLAGRVWPLESHPFTIASLPSSPSSSSPTSQENAHELVFVLRVHKGFTQRLAQAAVAPGSAPTLGLQRVFVNGPYSAPPVLVGYQRVVLIAGGSGVSFIVPLLLDVVRRARAGECACESVLFIWAIRDIHHITFIKDLLAPLLAPLPSTLSIQILFYLTTSSSYSHAPNKPSSDSSSIASAFADEPDDDDPDTDIEKFAYSEPATPVNEREVSHDEKEESENGNGNMNEKTQTSALLELPFVRVLNGRPDVAALIRGEVAAATGRVSVNVCGTHSLAESTRQALRTPRITDILRGGPTVSLHVEGFGA